MSYKINALVIGPTPCKKSVKIKHTYTHIYKHTYTHIYK